jgi:hypothetical protein
MREARMSEAREIRDRLLAMAEHPLAIMEMGWPELADTLREAAAALDAKPTHTVAFNFNVRPGVDLHELGAQMERLARVANIPNVSVARS